MARHTNLMIVYGVNRQKRRALIRAARRLGKSSMSELLREYVDLVIAEEEKTREAKKEAS